MPALDVEALRDGLGSGPVAMRPWRSCYASAKGRRPTTCSISSSEGRCPRDGWRRQDCLAVELPAGLQERHARQEIELLLRVWQLMHPNIAVDVI